MIKPLKTFGFDQGDLREKLKGEQEKNQILYSRGTVFMSRAVV